MGASSMMPPGGILSVDLDPGINTAQHTLEYTPASTVVPPTAAEHVFSTRLSISTLNEASTYITVQITVQQQQSSPTNITFSPMYTPVSFYGYGAIQPPFISVLTSTMAKASSLSSLRENSSPGIVVGYLTTVDPDPEEIGLHRYVLDDDASGRVALDSSSPGVVVSGATPSNYEAEDTFSFTVTSCDPKLGKSKKKRIHILFMYFCFDK